jgi:hypothetical protein
MRNPARRPPWQQLLALLGASALAACAATNANAQAQAHSIVGKWTWTRQANNCTETYRFRANGTYDVVSGKEIASGKYEMSPAPDANGFFTMKGQALKTNGARDCSDSGSQGSDWDKPFTVYILFHRGQPTHQQCYEPMIQLCFGPLRRVPE